ncbi:MAG TPA: PSD1 and planctomycete cytochrome C domain-containing protein, partial [Tepidisphaeraceae bacterium]|nr:PSD1 and planctomycete cytochrome C domain-containing protein [Tepidisphaeraceae bacterium]
KCHSASSEKLKGGLRLDARELALKGGESGKLAIVPGDPEKSLLIEAVRYSNTDLQMPPKKKLSQLQIDDLTAWVKMGAPWPADKPVELIKKPAFDLKERAKHWAFQPLLNAAPPQVKNAAWCRSPIDKFILAKLEQAGLNPAPLADKRTLIRRVTFDLVGLPPTPQEIEAFLADESSDAFAKVVDRLLASPHYGERWGRHWLDLVRYAESCGHEFDFDMPLAYQYRDYIIRAFNLDLPYDQMVREAIAGDLLPNPRRNPEKNFNESIIGTGFLYLGEAVHSPVDIREDEGSRIDNQIDVLAKTFQALTVSCARCHDHKFDAISTRDYYALVGFMQSTRYQEAFVDSPERIGKFIAQLQQLQLKAAPLIQRGLVIDAAQLDALARDLGVKERQDITHPLYPWLILRNVADFAKAREELVAKMKRAIQKDAEHLSKSIIFERFDKPDYFGWFVTGQAFGSGPTLAGAISLNSIAAETAASSGQLSRRLQGALRSRTFTISHDKICYRVRGSGATVNLIIDGFQRIRDPIYGGLTFKASKDLFDWHIQDVANWKGHKAYIEILDNGDEEVSISQIRFCDQPPPDAPDAALVKLLDDPSIRSPQELAQRYAAAAPAELLNLAFKKIKSTPELAELMSQYRKLESQIPAPTRVIAAADGTGVNERVFIRGNYKTPGDEVYRRFLEAIAGDQPIESSGSGRLELAERMLSRSNPLRSRVMVNRIWQHHFGEGIVRSVDDFGVMGQPPTHPELLDFLANQFIKNGWSIKSMHRLMLLSSTYQMSSQNDGTASKIDPQNKLLQHMPVRRLEAEAIRDSLLSISGRFDKTMYGPSVLPYLTPFMSGRGRPAQSGPLDGDGRRTIYLNVRRNFLSPMLLSFDYPIPATTIGRRNVSNVPAQALTMLNNPFVIQQAQLWARRTLAEPNLTPEQRINNLYIAAFARPPQLDELDAAKQFLEGQQKQYSDPIKPWTDLCHVLINVKEFIFVN